jgi:hypothetical protein
MPPVKCPKCFKMIASKKSLKVHLQRKNPCDKVCPVCKLRLLNQRAYHEHKQTHIVTKEPMILPPSNDKMKLQFI